MHAQEAQPAVVPQILSEQEMGEPGGGAPAAKAAAAAGLTLGSIAAFALVAATAASFYQVKYLAGPGGSKGVERDGNYLKGLAVACLALVGNAMVGAFRKILSQHNIGSAQQVFLDIPQLVYFLPPVCTCTCTC